MEVNGVGTFCLPKFKVKFKTRNGGIFMFHSNNVGGLFGIEMLQFFGECLNGIWWHEIIM